LTNKRLYFTSSFSLNNRAFEPVTFGVDSAFELSRGRKNRCGQRMLKKTATGQRQKRCQSRCVTQRNWRRSMKKIIDQEPNSRKELKKSSEQTESVMGNNSAWTPLFLLKAGDRTNQVRGNLIWFLSLVASRWRRGEGDQRITRRTGQTCSCWMAKECQNKRLLTMLPNRVWKNW